MPKEDGTNAGSRRIGTLALFSIPAVSGIAASGRQNRLCKCWRLCSLKLFSLYFLRTP